MGNLILLRNRGECPKCRAKSKRTLSGHCANCGMMLFVRPIDFQQYEADGNCRLYWLWTQEYGWIFRDHIINGLQPLSRHVDLTTPALNTKTAQERAAEIQAETQAQIRERMPRRNLVGYGKSVTRL